MQGGHKQLVTCLMVHSCPVENLAANLLGSQSGCLGIQRLVTSGNYTCTILRSKYTLFMEQNYMAEKVSSQKFCHTSDDYG